MADPVLINTRRALHGVAELVLAGPQHRRTDLIHLRPLPGGFGTVAEPDLRIEGTFLVAGANRIAMSGTTIGALAEAVGVDVGGPADLYHGGSGARPDDEVDVDPAAAAEVADCFARGDEALRRIAPAETPMLWPEHFDLGITVDEINYGVSPGDDWLAVPYAYVGPWQHRTGEFWTAPFGAARPMSDFADVDALVAFLVEGRERAALDQITPTGEETN